MRSQHAAVIGQQHCATTRREHDILQRDEVPQRGSLLWVYEGMTQYWGTILTARSGLWTREQALDSLALTAASYQNMSGREWRSVADTTMDPVLSARRPAPWRVPARTRVGMWRLPVAGRCGRTWREAPL